MGNLLIFTDLSCLFPEFWGDSGAVIEPLNGFSFDDRSSPLRAHACSLQPLAEPRTVVRELIVRDLTFAYLESIRHP
jgi:hypothetical protein